MSNNKENLYTREELLDLGIYDLRELGRDVGVVSPTTLKKEQLVDAILSVIYGEAPKRNVGKGRGRPSRNKNKPCQLFVDLVGKIEEPTLNVNFVDVEYIGNQFSGQLDAVASNQKNYVSDKNVQGKISTKVGVVSIENMQAKLKKLKFVDSPEDIDLSQEIIEQYNLKDNDVIECLIEGNKLLQVVKVNDCIYQPQETATTKKEPSIQIQVENKIITTNQANLVYLPVLKEREGFIDSLAKGFEDKGFNIVKVCFDRTGKGQKLNNKKVEIFADCIGDEFETIAMAEEGIKRASFLNNSTGKTLLIIDNIGWLKSVVDTYPKEVYGNFIEKMLRLTKGENSNITVVCAISKNKADNEQLYNLFDFVV